MTFWDDNATPAGVFNVGDMYDEYTRRQAAFIVEQLDVDTVLGVVVDLGCGIGRLTRPVAKALPPGVHVWGLDSSEAMIRKAESVHPAYYGAMYARYPRGFFADSVDGAWSVLTFQHLPDTTVKQHLADLFEILKPGARLVTQWVTAGEPGPMSYPRDHATILSWMVDAVEPKPIDLDIYGDGFVTGYSDDWLWVVAEKPA